MQTLLNIASIAFLVLGFGFVIFWHELGHFLAAKAVGIKVEQFALGMGSAFLSWRKGLGLSFGSSARKYQSKILTEWEKRQAATDPNLAAKKTGPTSTEELAIAQSLGLGETEYRFNYFPIGGYVKMLGQDDMDLSHSSPDPRAYSSQSIRSRTAVISAGVIMNIILAAALFVGLFLFIGFKAPPAIAGSVSPGSPAAKAGLLPGDRILTINGSPIADFTKLQLGVVLLQEGTPVPVEVQRDGKSLTLAITPEKSAAAGNVLALGVGPTPALRGFKVTPDASVEMAVDKPDELFLSDFLALKPGDIITAINGAPVTPERPTARNEVPAPSQYGQFLAALDSAGGKPITLTLEDATGAKRDVSVRPFYQGDSSTFNGPLNFAGIVPRPLAATISPTSSARGKLLPGDAITSLTFDETASVVPITSEQKLRETLLSAGTSGQPFTLTLDRDGQPATATGLSSNIKLASGKKGLGVGIFSDASSNVVADILENTPAERAGITPGSRVTAVNDKPVASLFEFRQSLLSAARPDGAAQVAIAATNPQGQQTAHTMTLTRNDLAALASLRPASVLSFDERIEPRKTDNPVTAMKWGLYETRDCLVKGYITLKRIAERSVPASMMNGPVGIFHVGGQIATNKTVDWTIWFLAIISANLAVVNFLPLPLLDGGHIVFLALEKIMGRPLAPKTQQIIQLAGIALIASVFLFVTYNDITRLLT